MEDFVARYESPLDTCIKAVAGSEFFVGLIGHNYGSCPQGEDLSFTQLEYEAARENQVPSLFHVAPNELKLPAVVRESDGKYEKQKAFRARILQQHTVGRSEHWKSPELLASFVSEAVSQLMREVGVLRQGIERQSVRDHTGVPAADGAPGVSSTRDGNDALYPKLVLIRKGRLEMGSLQDELDRDSCEGPRHEVVIHRDYYIGKYPITVDEFGAFARDTGFSTSGIYVWREQGWIFDRKHSWADPGFAQSGRHPVVGVSYHDAAAYCRWISSKTGKLYRLPSEAEWEYACRAGTRTVFWWGDEIGPENANYDARSAYIGGGEIGECRHGTVPVDFENYPLNPWGLSQTHGNVWEWCADAWNDTYVASPSNGQPWLSGDASRSPVRGGSWLSIPSKLRSAKRDWDGRELRGDTVGFRVVREVSGASSLWRHDVD